MPAKLHTSNFVGNPFKSAGMTHGHFGEQPSETGPRRSPIRRPIKRIQILNDAAPDIEEHVQTKLAGADSAGRALTRSVRCGKPRRVTPPDASDSIIAYTKKNPATAVLAIAAATQGTW